MHALACPCAPQKSYPSLYYWFPFTPALTPVAGDPDSDKDKNVTRGRTRPHFMKASGNPDLRSLLWVMIHTMAEAANIGIPEDHRERIEPFLGSWALISFEHVLPSGEVLRPFGDSPSGSILYQPDGHMSAQLSAGNPAKFANGDPDRASAEEATHAWRTYFGYWGSFKVIVEKRVVVHRVEGSSFPNWVGTEQVRHFRFEGADRLILDAQSSSGRYTLTWRRRVD